MFAEILEGLAPQYNTLWQPWLGPWSGADHSLVFPGSAGLAAARCCPCGAAGADRLPQLRQPRSRALPAHHAADFLQAARRHRAVCLENAVNRSRLVRSGITDVLTGCTIAATCSTAWWTSWRARGATGGRWPA
jgi:two-component system, cell cycle response regulator